MNRRQFALTLSYAAWLRMRAGESEGARRIRFIARHRECLRQLQEGRS